jgi:hypothetical protein
VLSNPAGQIEVTNRRSRRSKYPRKYKDQKDSFDFLSKRLALNSALPHFRRHSLKEVLTNPAVVSQMKDTKSYKEVQALETFFSMLSTVSAPFGCSFEDQDALPDAALFALLLKTLPPIPQTSHLLHFGPAMSDLGSSLSVRRLLSVWLLTFRAQALAGPLHCLRGKYEFQRKPFSNSLCDPPCLPCVLRVASKVVLSPRQQGSIIFSPVIGSLAAVKHTSTFQLCCTLFAVSVTKLLDLFLIRAHLLKPMILLQ